MINSFVVSSLSEYIAAIERFDLFNCISRGENQKYEYPLRSGIQRKELKDYSNLLENYHHDVETTINQIQDKYFLAFAQHHGMPTNLLDFSFSPLVSLYFSVNKCKDEGYVHFINKSKMINVNKVIYDKTLGWGMFEDLLNFDLELCKYILPQMSVAFMSNREEMIKYFENHAENFIKEFRKHRAKSCLDSLKGGVDDFEEALIKYKEYKPEWEADDKIHDEVTLQIYDSFPNFLESMQKIYIDDYRITTDFFAYHQKVSSLRLIGADNVASVLLMLFLLKMEEKEYCYNKCFNAKWDYELEFPFYLTYHPPVIDERVRNQSSVFIFQPFSTNRHYIERVPIQIWQKIIPDFTIKIQNPETIKRELDAMGFNLKHIFCDYDSIAKSIVGSS